MQPTCMGQSGDQELLAAIEAEIPRARRKRNGKPAEFNTRAIRIGLRRMEGIKAHYSRRGHWTFCVPDPASPMTHLDDPTIMPDRQRLSNRRAHELLEFEHAGIRYTAGVGRFGNGDLAEIFLSARKHGTAVDVNARDCGVAASLLLQHGCAVSTLRKALTRNSDGSAGGPLGVLLDLLEMPDDASTITH
jgi:hypothetical protein